MLRILSLLLLLVACGSPDPQTDALEQSDAQADTYFDTRLDTRVDTALDAALDSALDAEDTYRGDTRLPDVGTDASCLPGTHLCGDTCVSNNEVATCGDRCTPCDTPANAAATCDGSCGFECVEGYSLCDGVCTEGSSCAITLPDACAGGESCGAAGECVESVCVCATGYRMCAGGCCPVAITDTQELSGVSAIEMQAAMSPDGTVYIALREDGVATSLIYESVAGSPPVRLPVSLPGAALDFVVAAPRHLVGLSGRSSGGDGMDVRLVDLRLDDTTPVTWTDLGTGYGNGGGGMTQSADGTIWAAWSAERNRDFHVAEIATDRTVSYSRVSVSGSVERIRVAENRVSGDVIAFWGHRYTGTFRTGAESLRVGGRVTACPADFVDFRSDGTEVSLYDTYSSIVTYACVDGQALRVSLQPAPASIPNRFYGKGFDVLPDGTIMASYFDIRAENRSVNWVTSTDGSRWSHMELPLNYPDAPSGTDLVWTAVVSNARGEIAIVSVPRRVSAGPMQVVRLE